MTSIRERLGCDETADSPGSDGEDAIRASADQSTALAVRLETGLTLSAYVQWLLADNGGRMRQQEIVEQTGWSEYTVSRILTRMEIEETIDRSRVGHEKLVMIPETVDESAAAEPEDRDAGEES